MGSRDDTLRAILQDTKVIAVIGLSAKPDRPSNDVFAFLLARGYDCIGVNPGLVGTCVHGVPVVASLASIERPIDMVDVFRASDAVDGIVDEMLALVHRPKVLWTQLGVVNEAAAAKARAAGLSVVMDRCPKIELMRL